MRLVVDVIDVRATPSVYSLARGIFKLDGEEALLHDAAPTDADRERV